MSFNPLETPLNTLFAASIAYCTFRILWPSVDLPKKLPSTHSEAYNWLPPRHPETLVFKNYTPKTLEPFNGQNGSRILLAIDREVFDVTSGRSFYGPGGAYGNFAGRDASRGMAKQSFDMEMLTPVDQPIDKLEDLDQTEIDNMKGTPLLGQVRCTTNRKRTGWVSHFRYKYIVVGKLVENEDT
ncbi:related to membrane steroid binding protein [Serendipita indica DSM 11827]|uniref:Related to membrane steroid binding protein n=1 Tax=Serendipita indica (strain DSM 11827) TaxID=1109443 RepID=G4T518_SERID|nr:related to membrane steroid binding protein [Serendipita indica DSM 11827]